MTGMPGGYSDFQGFSDTLNPQVVNLMEQIENGYHSLIY
jgi:hypothetical protein